MVCLASFCSLGKSDFLKRLICKCSKRKNQIRQQPQLHPPTIPTAPPLQSHFFPSYVVLPALLMSLVLIVFCIVLLYRKKRKDSTAVPEPAKAQQIPSSPSQSLQGKEAEEQEGSTTNLEPKQLSKLSPEDLNKLMQRGPLKSLPRPEKIVKVPLNRPVVPNVLFPKPISQQKPSLFNLRRRTKCKSDPPKELQRQAAECVQDIDYYKNITFTWNGGGQQQELKTEIKDEPQLKKEEETSLDGDSEEAYSMILDSSDDEITFKTPPKAVKMRRIKDRKVTLPGATVLLEKIKEEEEPPDSDTKSSTKRTRSFLSTKKSERGRIFQ